MLRFDHINTWRRTMIFAHRGAGHAGSSPTTHENTIAAFKAAINIGVDAIELDLRRTRNGVIIVHHDDEIEGMKWPIGEMPADDVKNAASILGYEIPTLEETLQVCAGEIALDIELKETGYEDEVVEMVARHYDLSNIAFTSFHDMAIRRIKEYNSEAITGLLLGAEPPAGVETRLSEIFPRKTIDSCRPDFLAPNWRYLKWMGRHKNTYFDLPIITWTVDDIDYAKKLIEYEIAAIISNVPDKLLPLIG